MDDPPNLQSLPDDKMYVMRLLVAMSMSAESFALRGVKVGMVRGHVVCLIFMQEITITTIFT